MDYDDYVSMYNFITLSALLMSSLLWDMPYACVCSPNDVLFYQFFANANIIQNAHSEKREKLCSQSKQLQWKFYSLTFTVNKWKKEPYFLLKHSPRSRFFRCSANKYTTKLWLFGVCSINKMIFSKIKKKWYDEWALCQSNAYYHIPFFPSLSLIYYIWIIESKSGI